MRAPHVHPGARRKLSQAPPPAGVRTAGAPPAGERPRLHTHTPPAAPAASTVPLRGRHASAATCADGMGIKD